MMFRKVGWAGAEVTSFKWKTHRSDLAAHENERTEEAPTKKRRRGVGDGGGREWETNSFRLRHRRRIDGRFPPPPASGRPVDRVRSPPNEQRAAAEVTIASEELGKGKEGVRVVTESAAARGSHKGGRPWLAAWRVIQVLKDHFIHKLPRLLLSLQSLPLLPEQHLTLLFFLSSIFCGAVRPPCPRRRRPRSLALCPSSRWRGEGKGERGDD